MADDKKNDETIEETAETTPEPEAEETPAAVAEESDATEAPAEDAAVAEPAAEEATPEVEAVSDTTETADEAATVAEVSDTPAAEETPAARAKKQKSLKHVPRSARRTRSKPAREKPATRKPITRTEKPESELGRRQERRGVVVSDKGDKTIVVKVDVIKSHAKYKKVIRRAVKFHAHDEANTAGVGDTVRIVETRPLSKTKRWRLAEIVEKAR
jgi:small subunit ribosomal protein S17